MQEHTTEGNWSTHSLARYGISLLIAVSVTLAVIFAQPEIKRRDYHARIERRRDEVDTFMASSSESPIMDQQSFAGLRYYEPDAAYISEGTLQIYSDKKIIEVPTSANTVDKYILYGSFTFPLLGESHTLEVWKSLEGQITNRLFVAFTDATSGVETYGGGRYLELYEYTDDSILIDFNYAYNPYCVYDPSYICPLAPPENRLSIAIRAGEKMYQ